MKLFYLPGSCALGPHIALELCGLAYEAIRVERGRQNDPAYLAVNPLGRVPALVTDAHGTITEAPVVLAYIAEVVGPGHGLLPSAGSPARYEVLRWMAYLSSTVHPAIGRLWRPERFCDEDACRATVEHAAARQLAEDFAYIDRHLEGREWAVGDRLSVADLHFFVFGRLGFRLPASTRDFPAFHRHTMKIAELAATQQAIAQQGITLHGPAVGPG
jgi:glutathione S-transferase